ncbi:hypothetical protein JXJ21_09940 [candidate division KSB1 bacterium]|nr:hypothetical protein [candidate division KSB1 bacterium]
MVLQRVISFVGIFVLLGIAWLLSNNKKKIKYRVVIWGLLLQLVFAFIILKTSPGRAVFDGAKAIIVRVLAFTDEGAGFLFGNLYRANQDISANLSQGSMSGHVLMLDSGSESILSLNDIEPGTQDSVEISIVNPGPVKLTHLVITLSDSEHFEIAPADSPMALAAGDTAKIVLLALPDSIGLFSARLVIQSDQIPYPTTVPLEFQGAETAAPNSDGITSTVSLAQFKDLGIIFAIHILPTIIFFASLMSMLYHLGIMQRVVQFMAWIMSRTMGTSGAESLSAASNIFVGQTEAPLVIRPYISEMTMSELMAIMTGGFATIAGGVMAAYVRFGVDAGHLMAASVMSAPAALVMAKIIFPETGEPKTTGTVKLDVEKRTANIVDAAATGASDGLKLAVNVGAMLMAFISLIALLNFILGHIDEVLNFVSFGLLDLDWNLSLKTIFGYVFAPISFFMGVEWKDLLAFGNLLGTKVSINELVAYLDLAKMKSTLSPRSYTIATYALCGFANFSSIAIQIGGIGSIAPGRRSDLAKLGIKAMIGGALASWLTATIAGMLL